MPIFPPEEQFWQEWHDMKVQIAELQRTRQMNQSSIRDGSVKIVDDQGRTVVQLGKLDPGNEWGLEVFDPDAGETVLQLGKLGGSLGHGIQVIAPNRQSHTLLVTDTLGNTVPWQVIPFGTASTDIRALTQSSSFVEMFLCDFVATAAELAWTLAIATPTGGSCDVRATLQEFGESEVTLATETYDTDGVYAWNLPNAIAVGDIGKGFRLRVKAKKNSGSGDVSIGVVNHLLNRP